MNPSQGYRRLSSYQDKLPLPRPSGDNGQAGTDTTPYFVALVRLVDDHKDTSNTRCGILAPDEVEAINWCITHL